MQTKLTIVSRNPNPNRVESYPRAWLVYAGRTKIFRVLVERGPRRTYVVGKVAA